LPSLSGRTAANKEKNAAIVKENIAYSNPVYDESRGVKLVRYQGQGDSIPVTRIMSTAQVQELEGLGFKL
jgi:hypothetical protein